MFTSSSSNLSVPAKSFVVASGYFPPIVGGTSTVINNLLAAFDPERFAVISQTPESLDGLHRAEHPAAVRVTRLGVPRAIINLPYGLRIGRWLRFGAIPLIERAILKEIHRLEAERVIAVYPSWPFVIAAYRASRRARIPLGIYYMDVTPDASQLGMPDRFVVRRYEQEILLGASQRLVLSEALQEDFHTRFGLDSVVIPHSIDLSATAPLAPRRPEGSPRLLVHTGVIEHLQEEGLLRIASLLSRHREWNAKLVLCTPTSKADLLSRGFDSPQVEIVSLSNSEVRSLQASADLLVAVLPFHGAIEAYQRTAFPTKTVEYMASGVPILAHAPPDSFFARHVRKNGYGLLADSCQEQSLAQAISRALEDSSLRTSLLENARQTVNRDFSIGSVSTRFAAAAGISREALLKA